jgi:hypothetical protein
MRAEGTLRLARAAAGLVLITLLLTLPRAAPQPPWRAYTFDGERFSPLPTPVRPPPATPSAGSPEPPPVPADWRVTAAQRADVTGDGRPEWVLLVWRPWRDWPIQRWSPAPSPIADFKNARGESCHLILLDPTDGREIWAGSALPAPLVSLVAGDVTGDGHSEVVTLEGRYADPRAATHVDVWRWEGFGFALAWRSPPGTFHHLRLTPLTNDSTLDIAVR